MTHSTARGWALLTGAIAAEVVATLSLKAALEVPALFVVVALGYLAAFVLLTLVLRAGMALGVAYGVWAAAGVALTAMLSAAIYGEPLTPLMGIGIGLVIAGVLCVELGSHGGRRAPVRDAGAGSEDDGLARGRGSHRTGSAIDRARGRLMAWLFLIGAIITEVSGTLALRMAALGGRGWFAVVGVGYVLAFTLLALALGAGMALGVAYGIWAAAGVALTALLGRLLFGEPFTWVMGVGVVLIMGGVLLIEVGAH